MKTQKKILEAANIAGIKRAGIMVAAEGKFITELIGTQSMAFPVKIKKEIAAEKKFLEKALEKANKKLEKNYFQLKEFEKAARKKLK